MAMNPRLLVPRASGYTPIDADARVYVTAVQSADGSRLEPAVAKAIDELVQGLKTDGAWANITHCALFAGPRTIAGLSTALKGTAPTSNVFTTSDLARKTGLKGDTSNTKFVNANVNNNTFTQDDFHMSIWVSEAATGGSFMFPMGLGSGGTGACEILQSSGVALFYNQSSSSFSSTRSDQTLGVWGSSRSSSTGFNTRVGTLTNSTTARTSQTPVSGNHHIFRTSTATTLFSNARIGWYSLGTAIDLGALQTRLNTYFTALAATNI
jgi:hypothetical protein